MPRFAILRHQSPRGPHWDLLLEMGESLKTWALPEAPQPGVETTCEALPDHRLMYLDYEGPISRGRGTVTRWDHGTYDLLSQSDLELAVALSGGKLKGRAVLSRSPDDPNRWRFVVTDG